MNLPSSAVPSRVSPPFPDLEAISFDFGNTLVQFPSGPMREVVALTAAATASLTGAPVEEFITVWGEERLRQFEEDVPEGHEADMDVRARRVLARFRTEIEPADGERWDDAALRALIDEADVQRVLEAYADAFVEVTPAPPLVGPMLGRLARRYRLAVTSNWPLTLSIERFVQRAGWDRHLTAIVVSHSVGWIKPHPRIFEVAAEALGVPSGPRILHVGDDPGADVVGAAALGWRTAWIRVKPEDSGLPVAPPAPTAAPDLIVESVLDLEEALAGSRTDNGSGGPDARPR